jgi:hypothetical protein
LRSFLQEQAPLAPQKAALFAADLAEQVAALHAEGRKPGPLDIGVRVETGGGRARPVIVESEIETEPHRQLDDVWVLGSLLADLLGAPMTPDRSPPPRPDNVPDALWSLVGAALATDPAARPTAAILARKLRDTARDLLLGVSPWPSATGVAEPAAGQPADPGMEVPVPGYVPVAGTPLDLPPPTRSRRGRRLIIVLAAAATVAVLAAVGVVGAGVISSNKDGDANTTPSAATGLGSTTPHGATGPSSPAAPPAGGGAPAQPGAQQPGAPQAGAQQPGAQPPGAPPANPNPNPPPPPSGSKSMNVGNNYGRATGSVSWNGTTAKASGRLYDTAAHDSQSWLRIAYKLNVGGTWKQRYAQPDPYVTVANGQSKNFSWSLGGAIKDVQWDVCSKRDGKTYCAGWH